MSGDAERLIGEMFLQLKHLADKIDHLESVLMGSPVHVEGWAKPHKAAAALQAEGVQNAKHLQQLRLDGAFDTVKNATRDVSKGQKAPRWEYHIPRCKQALQRHFR